MKTPHSLIPEQKENAKHGEVYFPIQKYISKLSADSPVITTHWHEEAELTLITKGSPVYSTLTPAFHYPEKQCRILLGNLCVPYESSGWK